MGEVVGRELSIRARVAEDAEALLGATLHAVEVGVMITSLEHTALVVNRKFGELWGVRPEAVVASDVDEVRGSVMRRLKDPDAWLANLERVYADPEARETDELALRAPARILRRVTGPVRDAEGRPVARFWTFEDETPQKRREKLADSLARVSERTDPDPARVIADVLEAVSDHFRSPAEIVEIPVPTRLHAPLLRPDGSRLALLSVADGRDEEPSGAEDRHFLTLCAMRLASEIERARQTDQLRDDLRRTEEALAAAREEAVRAGKLAVVGTLAASVAHDIRNILSAVSLEISLGRSEPAVTLESVRTHLDRFQVLSHRLLSYARPSGLMPGPTSPAAAVERAAALLRATFGISHVTLTTDLDPLALVAADPGRLDHLMVNLLLNAAQAAGEGGRVEAGVVRRGEVVEAWVRDDGPGVPFERRDALFSPFVGERSEGFGLGLFSVRTIVEESGGTVAVEDAPGGGALFRMRWPLS